MTRRILALALAAALAVLPACSGDVEETPTTRPGEITEDAGPVPDAETPSP